jgi:hypothetical protein
MKKVYQTIVSSDNGDCMQAAIASLFELELKQVPNFIELGSDWHEPFVKFFEDRGYGGYSQFNPQRIKYEEAVKALTYDNGVDGYFYATVPSQTFEDVTHAVICDTKMNIVHDPNPNQLALNLKPEDILQIQVSKDNWHFDIDKTFKIEEV